MQQIAHLEEVSADARRQGAHLVIRLHQVGHHDGNEAACGAGAHTVERILEHERFVRIAP